MTSVLLDVTKYTCGTKHPPHAHEELQISIVLRGTVIERVGSMVEQASALSVVVKDPCVTHENSFGDALIARLSARRLAFGDLVEHPSRAIAWRWTHDASIAAPFLRIVARGAPNKRQFLTTADDDLCDLVAALSASAASPARGEAPAWLRDAVAQIREGWRPGLTVQDVARAAGVHPVYLARCVRRWYGIAVGDLLRQARMRNAASAIATGDSTLSTVAHTLSFSDEPHLCREFARATGVTPGRYRRLADSLNV